MKIEIRKSEINIIKEALRDCSTLYHNDSWLGYNDDEPEYQFAGINGKEAYRKKIRIEIKHYPYEKRYKALQLKKLAMIEHRIVEGQVKEGSLKKMLGNLKCWWMWTSSDKRWENTKFAREHLSKKYKNE